MSCFVGDDDVAAAPNVRNAETTCGAPGTDAAAPGAHNEELGNEGSGSRNEEPGSEERAAAAAAAVEDEEVEDAAAAAVTGSALPQRGIASSCFTRFCGYSAAANPKDAEEAVLVLVVEDVVADGASGV